MNSTANGDISSGSGLPLCTSSRIPPLPLERLVLCSGAGKKWQQGATDQENALKRFTLFIDQCQWCGSKIAHKPPHFVDAGLDGAVFRTTRCSFLFFESAVNACPIGVKVS